METQLLDNMKKMKQNSNYSEIISNYIRFWKIVVYVSFHCELSHIKSMENKEQQTAITGVLSNTTLVRPEPNGMGVLVHRYIPACFSLISLQHDCAQL